MKEREFVQCVVERDEERALREYVSCLVLCFASVFASTFYSCLCIRVSDLLCFLFCWPLSNESTRSSHDVEFHFLNLVAIGEKVLVVCGLVLGLVVVLYVVGLVRQWFVYSWCAFAIDDPFDDERCKHSVDFSRASRSETLCVSNVGASYLRGCFCLWRFVGTLFVSLVCCAKRIRILLKSILSF